MTREEAARVLSGMLDDYRISSWDDDWYYGENVDALNVAIAALRGPEPDPDTGLVPCGCGGKAKIWPSDLRQAVVTAYQVGCTECAMTTGWVRGKRENAVKVWNAAMGWKGGLEVDDD